MTAFSFMLKFCYIYDMRSSFFYRYMTVRGIPYQYTHPKNIFLGTYRALDGTKRERWVRTQPDVDAFFRRRTIAERILGRHEVHKHQRLISRFAFECWFRSFGPTKETGYLFEYRLAVLNRMMYLVKRYLIQQNKPANFRCYRDSWDLMMNFMKLSMTYVNEHFKRTELPVV